jgi:G3E family GTPase
MRPSGEIPIWLLTGFLGSGKTSVLARLLRMREFADTAVIINELGEIGIDDALIESVEDDVVMLRSGCLCCSMGSSLEETLADLYGRRSKGSISKFRQVIVETTGLADPIRIVQSMIASSILGETFAFKGIVSTIDGLFGHDQLARQAEVRHQIAAADILLITKIDLCGGDVSALDREIRSLNPTALILPVAQGPDLSLAPLAAGMNTLSLPSAPEITVLGLEQMPTKDAPHADGIRSRSTFLDQPVTWPAYADWIDNMKRLPVEGLLRVKGLLNFKDNPQPVVVHAVHHVFSRPTTLESWPTDDRRSRLVVITRDIAPELVDACFAPLVNV